MTAALTPCWPESHRCFLTTNFEGVKMLVLSRFVGERIIIKDSTGNHDDIVVTFVESRGKKIRLGFEASKRFEIVREELTNGRGNEAPEDSTSEACYEPVLPPRV
jgi:carbon storage regulator CsrA